MTVLTIDGPEFRRYDTLWRVLHTTDRSQVAIMILAPGEASSDEPSVHPNEDQLLYLIDGEVEAQIGKEQQRLRSGQLAVVPASTPHRFINIGSAPARTLNIYTPPAY